MRRISEIKAELAGDVENIVKSMAAEVVIIYRAMQRPRNFRGKYICRVNTLEAANNILAEINLECQMANELAEEADIQLPHPIKYSVNIIDSKGTIHLNKSEAKSVKIEAGENIPAYIKQSVNPTMTRSSVDAAEQLTSLLEILQLVYAALYNGTLKRDRKYRVCRSSGTAHRLTYFDNETQRRRQINVGDVLIVIDRSPLNIDMNTKRKERPTTTDGKTVVANDVWTITELSSNQISR